MKRILVCLLFLHSLLILAPSAWANWGSFASTGTATAVGNPSCALVSTGHVACAFRNGTGSIMVNEFNGTAWGKWTNLVGTVSSDPTCTNDGASKVICTAPATNGNLQVTIFNGTSWTKPAKLAGALYSAPSCAELTAGQVLCAARSSTGGLAWSVYNGTARSKFANLATSAVSGPACATDNGGGVICAVFTTGDATLVNRFAGGAWEGFLNLGGIAAGAPDCTSMNSAGQVVCFAEAYNSQIFATRFVGGSWAVGDWTAYGSLGGEITNNASCTTQAAGHLVCGVVYTKTQKNWQDQIRNRGSGGRFIRIWGTINFERLLTTRREHGSTSGRSRKPAASSRRTT